MRFGPFYFGLRSAVPRLQANLIYLELGCIHDVLRQIMIDNAKLVAAVARLEAADTAMIGLLTSLSDSSRAAAARIADLSAQLAHIPSADSIQNDLENLATQLNADADAVEAAVAANTAVPDMPPASPPEPAPSPAPSTDPAA